MGDSKMSLEKLKNELVKYSRMLADKKLVVSSGGNISFIFDERIYITPTGVALDEVEEESLAVLDLEGNPLNNLKPSKEVGMHLEIYKKRDIRVIIHAHPFYSTVMASHRDIKSGKDIPFYTPGYIVKVGPVGLVGYYPPGSQELSAAVCQEIVHYEGVLMRNHGLIVVGKDFRSAFNLIEDIEVNARMFLEYGDVMEPLTPEVVKSLRKI